MRSEGGGRGEERREQREQERRGEKGACAIAFLRREVDAGRSDKEGGGVVAALAEQLLDAGNLKEESSLCEKEMPRGLGSCSVPCTPFHL